MCKRRQARNGAVAKAVGLEALRSRGLQELHFWVCSLQLPLLVLMYRVLRGGGATMMLQSVPDFQCLFGHVGRTNGKGLTLL